ncbi:MAG: hypothetical protein ACOY3K_04555 [Candidatus Omnitrophota bacterium]
MNENGAIPGQDLEGNPAQPPQGVPADGLSAPETPVAEYTARIDQAVGDEGDEVIKISEYADGDVEIDYRGQTYNSHFCVSSREGECLSRQPPGASGYKAATFDLGILEGFSQTLRIVFDHGKLLRIQMWQENAAIKKSIDVVGYGAAYQSVKIEIEEDQGREKTWVVFRVVDGKILSMSGLRKDFFLDDGEFGAIRAYVPLGITFESEHPMEVPQGGYFAVTFEKIIETFARESIGFPWIELAFFADEAQMYSGHCELSLFLYQTPEGDGSSAWSYWTPLENDPANVRHRYYVDEGTGADEHEQERLDPQAVEQLSKDFPWRAAIAVIPMDSLTDAKPILGYFSANIPADEGKIKAAVSALDKILPVLLRVISVQFVVFMPSRHEPAVHSDWDDEMMNFLPFWELMFKAWAEARNKRNAMNSAQDLPDLSGTAPAVANVLKNSKVQDPKAAEALEEWRLYFDLPMLYDLSQLELMLRSIEGLGPFENVLLMLFQRNFLFWGWEDFPSLLIVREMPGGAPFSEEPLQVRPEDREDPQPAMAQKEGRAPKALVPPAELRAALHSDSYDASSVRPASGSGGAEGTS